MNKAKIAAVLTTLFVSACATSGANYVPIVDGPVGPNFNADLAQCQALSRQQGVADESTAASAATAGAVAGASSIIINDNSSNLGEAVAVGALLGATGSAVQNNRSREVIIRNCMRGRGYNVVG